MTSLTFMEIIEQAPILHELGDNVDGLSFCADGVELDQLLVLKFLHDLGLGEEVLDGHGARFQCLDGHRGSVVPETLPDLSKLAGSELLLEGDGAPLDLPLVLGVVGEADRRGCLELGTDDGQTTAETI